MLFSSTISIILCNAFILWRDFSILTSRINMSVLIAMIMINFIFSFNNIIINFIFGYNSINRIFLFEEGNNFIFGYDNSSNLIFGVNKIINFIFDLVNSINFRRILSVIIFRPNESLNLMEILSQFIKQTCK